MEEIDSGHVMAMRNVEFVDILDELNATLSKTTLTKLFAFIALVVATFLTIAFWPNGIASLLFIIPAVIVGKWLDSYRRRSVLFYELEPNMEAAYTGFTTIIDELRKCSKTWHVAAGGDITDLTNWKRNAGASRLIDKKTTSFQYKLPDAIKSNITPPSLAVGTQTLFFFPDVILMQHGKQFGAVGYDELIVERSTVRFIEDGAVPKDTEIVDHTWQHPNKSGGPDRRFANNRQIPICLYEDVLLRSDSGLNEMISFSKPNAAEHFERYLRIIPKTLRPRQN